MLDPTHTIRMEASEFSLLQHNRVCFYSALSSSHICRPLVWQPPPSGMVKLNFDVAWRNLFSRAVIAVVARNASGNLIDGLIKHIWCYS